MLHEQINFTPDGRVNLKTYIHETFPKPAFLPQSFQLNKRPAIIIMPGGAYSFLSPTEAEPVALTFLKEGFNTFVLNYSVGEYSEFPNPLEEVSKAIWEVRKNADVWGIDPNAIAVMGFSAGANVAGLAATQWNTPGLAEKLGIPFEGNRPNAAIAGYGAADHTKFLDDPDVPKPNLGKIVTDRSPEIDIVNYVGVHTPPYFIWHTQTDALVPGDQPLILASKLQKLGLEYELHVFRYGPHGMSVYNNLSSYNSSDRSSGKNKNAGLWVKMCTNWLYELFNV